MRPFVVAVFVAAVTAASPVEGHPVYHYLGGCEMTATTAETPDERMQWSGNVSAVAVATDAATGAPAPVPITVECELVVNDAPPVTALFSEAAHGFVAATGPVSYEAGPYDVVTVCEHVTVGGEYHRDCVAATAVGVVPPPLWEAVVFLVEEIGPEHCQFLAGWSGGPADQPPAFDIRSDGDLYVAGEWMWDCPPYGDSGT